MKKIITMMVVLAVAGMAQASLINVGGNFNSGVGGHVYEYIDGDGDTAGLFTSGFTAYVINSSTVDPSLVDGMDPLTLSAVTDTAVSGLGLTIVSGIGKKVALTGETINVPDNSDVYTILVSELGDWAMVLDAPTDVGVFDPAAAYTPTQTIPAADVTIAMGSQDWLAVVPEPATIGLMGIAGLGMFLARRRSRS